VIILSNVPNSIMNDYLVKIMCIFIDKCFMYVSAVTNTACRLL